MNQTIEIDPHGGGVADRVGPMFVFLERMCLSIERCGAVCCGIEPLSHKEWKAFLTLADKDDIETSRQHSLRVGAGVGASGNEQGPTLTVPQVSDLGQRPYQVHRGQRVGRNLGGLKHSTRPIGEGYMQVL